MTLLRPRSLMGQMLLAVAAALLLVQGLGAFFVYRAQSERFEAAMLHGAAFRLAMEERGIGFEPRLRGHRRLSGEWRGSRPEASASSPLRTNETRDDSAEAALRQILSDDGLDPAEVLVTYRDVTTDPVALARALRRAERLGSQDRSPEGRIMVVGMRMEPGGSWSVTRSRPMGGQLELIGPLLLQTLTIYIVLMGAVAFILRRITRPLAALTSRVERFAATQDADGQLDPVGPDDVRRLIVAHNAMEARISALLDEKNVMLGAIGHDLKTPLAALRVRIEAVEDDTERGKMAATIEDIVRTLDDILSLARVGRPSDVKERSELSALVAAIVEEYEDMGEPVVLGLTSRIVLGLRPTWLRRAMRNLIGNALRYGHRARVSLAREGNTALIRIEDDGPGIAEDQIEAMMHPFARGEPSRNSETGGAGLGLALARAIAEQHGGRLILANRIAPDGGVAGLVATLALPIG